MKKRPMSIVVLALLQCLTPVASILLNAWLNKVSILQTFLAIWGGGWQARTEFLFLMPIAGIAIYWVKPWSYPIFASAFGWTVFRNWQDTLAPSSGVSSVPVSVQLLLSLSNAALVAYFLIPAVRTTYFNKAVRWWENQPRYPIDLRASLACSSQNLIGSISNISLGGIFFSCQAQLNKNDRVKVGFNILGNSYTFDACVVFCRENEGYGLQFIHTETTNKQSQQIIAAIRKLGIKPYLADEPRMKEAWNWTVKVLTTGKGIVPELPAQKSKANSEPGSKAA